MRRAWSGGDWRTITELLLARDVSRLPGALELLSPEQIDVAHGIVQRHGIGPWLAGRVTAAAVGPQSMTFLSWLSELRHLNAQRMTIWETERVRILEAMARANVNVLPLKGAALVPIAWSDPAERPTADLDLLAKPADLARVHDVLAVLGFVVADSRGRTRDYVPRDAPPVDETLPGEHPNHPIRIELLLHVDHDAAGIQVPLSPFLWASARENDRGRLTLPLDALVLHVALHAARHSTVRMCRFVNILDLAAAAGVVEPSVWEACAASARNLGISRFVYGALVMAERYTGATFPASAMKPLADDTPARVRRWVSTCDFADWYGDPRAVLLTARLAGHTRWGGNVLEQIGGAWRVVIPSRRNRESDAPTSSDAVTWRFVRARVGHWWLRERKRRRTRIGVDG